MQQLFAFTLHQLAYRDAGPRRDNLSDLLRANLLGDHWLTGVSLVLLTGFSLGDLTLQAGHFAVADASGGLEVAFTLSQFGAGTQLI